MKSKSIAGLALFLSLCGSGSAGGIDAPTSQASSWSPARYVIGVEVQQGTGVMRVRLSGSTLTWSSESEPFVSDEVLERCGSRPGANPSPPLEIELAGDPDQVALMTDLAMDAFMADFKVEVSIELAHCSSGKRYLIRDLRAS